MTDELYRILLVEDDPNLGYITQEGLEMQGFTVQRAANGEEALELFLQKSFDLALVDIMLPKKDGFTLVSEVRKILPDLPVIFLTAKSLKEDKIEGLRLGADDYITKPFSMEELVLRIQAVLRRSGKWRRETDADKVFQLGDYRFEVDQQTLIHTRETRKLTHREAELLRLLCVYRNQILERETALKLIWKEDTFFNARSMDVYISKLRKYLSLDHRISINNMHGIGFRLNIIS